MVVEADKKIVLKAGVSKQKINTDLNFRLRLDISGANIRIEDKIIHDDRTGLFYVDTESGLDIDFEIVQTYKRQSESKITIWNLSDSTYTKIMNDAEAFELYGAFSDDEFSLMFRGYKDITVKKSKKTVLTSSQGFLKQDANASRRGQNDLETIITLKDAIMEYQESVLNKEYQAQVSTETILNDCIESFGVPIGTMTEINHIMLPNYTAKGRTVNTLNYLAKRLNFEWTVLNGIFYTFSDKKPEQLYGIELNSSNSSTPERQSDTFYISDADKGQKVRKTQNGYKTTTGLLPFLVPGYFCACDFGEKLQGNDFFIYKVVKRGNNYGTKAETDVYVV